MRPRSARGPSRFRCVGGSRPLRLLSLKSRPQRPLPLRAASRFYDDSASHAAESTEITPAHATAVVHAPSPGATAMLIHDLRELFKVKVVGLVLVTGWGGFYLGSMQSGISSMQRGLLDALLGIGLVSAGAGALNEALERKTDARMKRTADRPLASGRFPLAVGIFAGLGALALGAGGCCCTPTCSPCRWRCSPRLPTWPFTRRSSASPRWPPSSARFPAPWGPLLGWTAARGRIEWPAVALFAILFVWQFPHFMSISWLYRDDYARAGIRMLPVVQPDGWSTVVEALFYAVLMIPVSLAPWWLGMTGAGLPRAGRTCSGALPGLHHPLRRHSARQDEDREPHAGARSAQGERALSAAAVYHAHALRQARTLRNR